MQHSLALFALLLGVAVPGGALRPPQRAAPDARQAPSVPAERGISASSQDPRRARRQRWAVVIGISAYADSAIPALKYADADARAFHDFLLSERAGDGGLPRDHVELLLNSDATYTRIRSALRTFLRRSTDDDIVVIYIAGHGISDPDRPEDFYLLAHDTRINDLSTAVPMEDVRDATRRLYARDVLVLVDACHSAGVGGESGRRGLEPNRINDVFLKELRRSSGGLAVFTASQVSQLSREGTEWGGGHGVFTYYVLQALAGAADSDGDSLVTLGEMTLWVQDNVRRATHNAQIPSLSQTRFNPSLPLSVTLPSSAVRPVADSSGASDARANSTTDAAGMPTPGSPPPGGRALPRSVLIATGLAALTASFIGRRIAAGRRNRRASTAASAGVVADASVSVSAPQPLAGPVLRAEPESSLAGGSLMPEAASGRPADVDRVAKPERPLAASLDAPPAGVTATDGALGGRYRIESELARAGSSVVYAATDVRLGRSVMAKVFQLTAARASQTERFYREVKLLARLQHPGIVALYDYGSVDEAVFYVMPRLAGESLRDRLNRLGALPVLDAVRIATQVAEALDYAHRQAVLHRNVRPESIWLTRSQALIGEFGLAKAFGVAAIGSLTTVGSTSLASADYSSPEQLVPGRDLDPRSDIYSLGCVLYEMATGRVPYRLESGEIDRRAKFSGPPEKASVLRSHVPATLDSVIEMALRPDVEQRYGSAIELARALAVVAADSQEHARINGLPESS